MQALSLASDTELTNVLAAALDVLRDLTSVWRREVQPIIDAEDYSPESIDHILRTWESLQTGAEGGTGGSYDGMGGGKHDRLSLAVMLADVELATDRALADKLHWRSVQRIYAKQGRELSIARIGAFTRQRFGTLEKEPPPPFARQACCEAIARRLGWAGYELAA